MQAQLVERDEVLRLRDEALAQLRETKHHLEGFRYVLLHKVQVILYFLYFRWLNGCPQDRIIWVKMTSRSNHLGQNDFKIESSGSK